MIPPEDFLIPAPSLTLGANPASTVVIRKSKQIELHMLHTAVPLSITNLVNPISVAAYTTIYPSSLLAVCQSRDKSVTSCDSSICPVFPCIFR